jgi:hypothetical protein
VGSREWGDEEDGGDEGDVFLFPVPCSPVPVPQSPNNKVLYIFDNHKAENLFKYSQFYGICDFFNTTMATI